MKIAFGILAASIFVAAAANAQPSPTEPLSVAKPTCVTCYAPGSNYQEGCTANYGVACEPNEEFDHCTAEQAAAWCPGWVEDPPAETPDCAVCYASGEAGGGSCYVSYGAQCNAVVGLNHCTETQARDWCAGWAERMAILHSTTPDQ